jgi:hypothetical protein
MAAFNLQRQIALTRQRELKRFNCAMARSLEKMRDLAPVDSGASRDSGRLGDAQRGPSTFGRDMSFGGPDAPGAFFTNVGTDPHVIELSEGTASVLSDGDSFFGTEVNHPGSREHEGWFSDNAERVFLESLRECCRS